jgi:thiol-disulfide isomerase/thioredoxin
MRAGVDKPALDALVEAAGRSRKAARSELVGQPAPPLVIERWHNGSFWQLDLKGKVVLLDFWGVWCGPCKRQIPEIVRLAREYDEKGLVTIGVHTQVGKENLPEFLAKNDLPYPIAVDHGAKTAEAYRVTGYPTITVVDREGILRGFDPTDLEATIRVLLAETQAPTRPAER